MSPALFPLVGTSFLSSVLADQAYGTVLALSGTVSLGYFPLILSLEGLVAGAIGVVAGLLGFAILRWTREGGRSFGAMLVALVPFAILWSGYFLLTNYKSTPLLFLVFLLFGLVLFAAGVLFARRTASRLIPFVLMAGGLVFAVLYPWVFALVVFSAR